MFLLLLIHETKMVRRKFISCTHSLHNFQFTCFGRHNQIAFFKMQTILPHGVKLPPQKIKLPDQFSREKELREELSNLAVHSKLGNLNFFVKKINVNKSQLILKFLFGVFNFSPINERKQFDLRYHSSKVKFFRSLFGRIEDTTKSF